MKGKPLILGIFFFLLSFSLGIGAMYYKAPKLVMDEEFSLKRGTLKSFSLFPPPMNALYYNLSCSSDGSMEVLVSFLDDRSEVIAAFNLTGNKRIDSGDYEYFSQGPHEVSLSLLHADEASCRLKLYYPSFDEKTLLLLVIAQLITSLIAISLIFSYYLKVKGRRSGLE